MKFFLLTFCLSAVLFKSISGGVIDTVEDGLVGLKNKIIQDLNEIAEPIHEGVKKLETRLIEYKIRQSEIEAFSFMNINFTACTDLGETIENSVYIGYNISITARALVMNITNSYNALISKCSKSWNPVTDVKCYVENIDIIKDEVESIKPLIKQYESTILDLVAKVEDQFFTCIGDKVPSTAAPIPPSTAKPEPSTAKPEPSTAKPEPSTAKPEPSTAKPEPSTAKPEPSTAKPEPSTAKPEPSTAKPEPSTAKSEPSTAKPEPSTAKPDNHVTTKPTKKPWWHFW